MSYHQPQRQSRKGRMLLLALEVHNMQRDWKPYNGKWQPSVVDRRIAKARCKAIRKLLDALEASL